MRPIIEKLEQISDKDYESNKASMRVIADHLRASTFLAVDGVTPSNKERGYVMRRLLRRAIRYAFDLGVEQNFIEAIIPVVTEIYVNHYPEIASQRDQIIAVLNKEEKAFRQTLAKGLRELSKLKDNGLTGKEVFTLYDTYGFPVELSTEEAFRQGIGLADDWREQFNAQMDEQRKRSQTAAKGVFKGGLSGDSEMNVKYHTTAHLLG
jgi:alanyl-tRNA synthetase